MKIKFIDREHYLYGNKGACWTNKVHIAKIGKSGTLCGAPMLATNWAAHWGKETPGCPACLKEYNQNKEV